MNRREALKRALGLGTAGVAVALAPEKMYEVFDSIEEPERGVCGVDVDGKGTWAATAIEDTTLSVELLDKGLDAILRR